MLASLDKKAPLVGHVHFYILQTSKCAVCPDGLTVNLLAAMHADWLAGASEVAGSNLARVTNFVGGIACMQWD